MSTSKSTTGPAVTHLGTLTHAEVLLRAENRLTSLIRRTGRIADPTVLRVAATYVALEREVLAGRPVRAYDPVVESSLGGLDLALRIVAPVGGAA